MSEQIRTEFHAYKESIAKDSRFLDGFNINLDDAFRNNHYFRQDCEEYVQSFRHSKIEFIDRDQAGLDNYADSDYGFYIAGLADWKRDPFYSPVSEDRFRYYLISFCEGCSQPYRKSRITQQQMEKYVQETDLEWSSSGDEEYVTKYGCCDSCRQELYREEDYS